LFDEEIRLSAIDTRRGLKHGHSTTPIPKAARPSHRKGILSAKTKLVRSIVREVAGFSAYERRVMELLRNSKVRAGEASGASADSVLLLLVGQKGP
jgi:Ribosomal protein L36e